LRDACSGEEEFIIVPVLEEEFITVACSGEEEYSDGNSSGSSESGGKSDGIC